MNVSMKECLLLIVMYVYTQDTNYMYVHNVYLCTYIRTYLCMYDMKSIKIYWESILRPPLAN